MRSSHTIPRVAPQDCCNQRKPTHSNKDPAQPKTKQTLSLKKKKKGKRTGQDKMGVGAPPLGNGAQVRLQEEVGEPRQRAQLVKTQGEESNLHAGGSFAQEQKAEEIEP